MAIFSNKNCLYKYERYKERKTKSVKLPHKHIEGLEILEKKDLTNTHITYFIYFTLHTLHFTLRRGM